MIKPRNDRGQAVTKFCLAMETHRRTEAGRVRTAKEFVGQFFPFDEAKADDQLFRLIPNEVRGPVLAAWGIRGAKAALKDDDDKVKLVVHDALVAGDIDEATFEEGVNAEMLVDWIELPAWWSFWRRGRLTGVAIQRALQAARELHLIDDKWFFENLQGRAGKLKGTDVVCDTLTKDQIVAWMKKVHETGDGSPAGLVAALGWETILTKTAQDALLFALDQFAQKAGLAESTPQPKAGGATTGAEPRPTTAAARAPSAEPETARHEKLAEAHPTVNAPSNAVAIAEAEALVVARAKALEGDGGIPVAIPDLPAEDGNAVDSEPAPETPWVGQPQSTDESPRLAEAREAMMATLMQSDAATSAPPPASRREAWEESEIPAKPSSLEWPEPPPVIAAPNGAGSAPPPSEDIIIEEDDFQKASASNVPAAAPLPSAAPKPPPPLPGGSKPGTTPLKR